jgi:hypothetical protein
MTRIPDGIDSCQPALVKWKSGASIHQPTPDPPTAARLIQVPGAGADTAHLDLTPSDRAEPPRRYRAGEASPACPSVPSLVRLRQSRPEGFWRGLA